MTTQREIIAALGVTPQIDPAAEIERRRDFLVEYLGATGAKGFVLGISGGQDSSLAGKLAQLAVEKVRADGGAATFTAVRLPYRVQADEADAQLALDFIQPDVSLVFDIAGGVDGIAAEYERSAGEPLRDYTKGNVKARMRMVAQYAIAGERGALVIGTDHAAEAVTGFFTKFGDGGSDVLPLSGLTKRQGRALLIALDAPARLYEKTPTADLLDDKPGQADEHELDMEYEQIDDFLEGREIDPVAAAELQDRYRMTAHKRTVPVGPDDTWWRTD
ncbi:ammonia-dependent NAD(+) synthetase [Salinibacterium sp. ZJ70]|uniref:ammonia-dependent NAD(+) synthetase n=1 Tax=Salinibacterium sp. ZJ70 TaxID=2708084 RepID=UPI00141E909E|nr:ammonia-dependent NAD(+) synthetase [Salinibacterium sp. ZJ70]